MKFNDTKIQYRAMKDYIRGEMRRQKISQSDMAYRLNMTQGNFSYKLSDKGDFTTWELLNVFEILGVEFEYGNR